VQPTTAEHQQPPQQCEDGVHCGCIRNTGVQVLGCILFGVDLHCLLLLLLLLLLLFDMPANWLHLVNCPLHEASATLALNERACMARVVN
jgi:hypothetical protein